MSKEIVCLECNTPNTHDSKFCNSCGALLPPKTSLICANCHISNPKDRLYCDNCGTRLVQDAQFTANEPGPEKPQHSRSKSFSLPIRPPGETGELDPVKAVPDWLRGDKQSTEETGEDETAGPANLPDWLIDLANPIKSGQATPSDDKLVPDKSLTSWLTDITQADDENDEQPDIAIASADSLAALSQSDAASSAAAGAADDLAVSDDETPEGLTDWLTNLNQPNDDLLTDLDMGELDKTSSEQAPMESEVIEEEVFEWLEETLPASSPSPSSEKSMTDWLGATIETATDESAESVESDVAGEISGQFDQFLADGGESWQDESPLAVESESEVIPELPADPEQPEATIADSSSDWLADLKDDSLVADGIDDATSILADIFTADETTDTDQDGLIHDEDIMEGAAKPEQPETTIADSSSDWLADLKDDSLVADGIDDATTILADIFATDETTDTDQGWFIHDEDKVEDTAKLEIESIEGDEELSGSESDMEWLAELEALGGETYKVDETAVAEDEGIEDTLTEEDTPVEESVSEAVTSTLNEDIFASDWPEEESDDDAADSTPQESGTPEEFAELEEFAESVNFAQPEPPKTLESQDSDWIHADTMLANALKEEMPDWLDELGSLTAAEAGPGQDDADAVFRPGDTLPGWIEQMNPGTVYTDIHPPLSSQLPDIDESLSDLPDELIGAELPDWLQNAADTPGLAESPLLSIDDSSAIPGWLQSESDEGLEEDGLAGLTLQSQIGSANDDLGDEWADILQDLPQAEQPEDRTVRPNIPDWIQALKPQVLSGTTSATESEKPIQTVGPLAGIRDVIDIEPIIAQPRGNGALHSFTVTNEQQTQAALLKQLTLAKQVTADPSVTSDSLSSIWVRVLLAVLLLAAIGVGLFQPNLLPRARSLTSPRITMAHSAIQEAAGQPVLLAVEYTPALAGELDAQAQMLVSQLEANGSPIITVSQYSAGTAVARALTDEQQFLGLVPGESVGLRQLGHCLSGSVDCATIANRPLDKVTQQTLTDVGLIIVLTGERDSLINWLEQIGRISEVPVIAGITQSLGPVAAPYFKSGQLQGMIVGMPDTAVYQQEFLPVATDSIDRQVSAQRLGQLVTAILLLLGSLFYGSGLFKRGKSSQA